MARIVINSWGSYGDIIPYVALARGLQGRGHHVTLAIPAHFHDEVRALGVPCAPVGPVLDKTTPDPVMVREAMHPRRGSEYIMRTLLLPPLRETFAQLHDATIGADLLVGHTLSFTAPTVAELLDVRYASTVLMPLAFGSRYEMIAPPQAPWIKAAEQLGPWVPRFFAWFMRRVSQHWMAPVYALRRELGLSRGDHPIFEAQLQAGRTLAMFSRVLATPRPDWSPHTTITGQLHDDALYNTALPPALASFLDAGEPPVVFTLGSTAVQVISRFYEESITAMQQLGGRAVFLAGPETTARLAHTLPPTMCMVEAAPHSRLFPRARAIVQHGGVGTLGAALTAGVPLVTVPFSHDQPDNAWRVAQLGVSRTIPIGRYRAESIRRALSVQLADPAVRQRAAEVGAIVRAERGVETACDILEAYLSTPRPSRGR